MFSNSGKNFSYLFTPTFVAKRLKSKKIHWVKHISTSVIVNIINSELYLNVYLFYS